MLLAPTPPDVAAAAAILGRDSPDVRASFCEAAVTLLQADTATLWEIVGGRLRLTAATPEDVRLVERTLPLGPGSAAGRAAADGVRFFAADALADPDADPETVARLGLRSILAEPIVTAGRTTGAVAIGWRRPILELDPLVSGFVSLVAVQASLTMERDDLARRLEHQALTDPLTGLLNRRGLARDLEREMARAARSGGTLGFALLDLDHFKAYNDRHGHAAGDLLLTRAARGWTERLRANDVLARYGGEEFVLLLPDCGPGPDAGLAIVERVRAATPSGVTASAGLALWDGREPPHRLLERADVALYAAKDHGRDRVLRAA